MAPAAVALAMTPKFEVVDTILEVDREQWDRLARDDVYASYGWLRTVEQTARADLEPRYLLVKQDERLVAVAACYLAGLLDRGLTVDGIVYGRFVKLAAMLGLSLLPALLCGHPFTYGAHVLLHSELDSARRHEICRRLLDELERAAGSRRLGLCFDNVFEDEAELVRLLRQRRYAETIHSPVLYLDVPWSSFDGYLRYLRGKSRNMARNAKREVRRLEREGIRIRTIEDTAPFDERLFELADRQWYRHNRESLPYRRDFFRRLRENLGRNAVVFGAFAGSSLVGFSLVLEKGGTGYGLLHGVDGGLDREAAAYFNLCFYAPIEAAIARHGQRLYCGRALPEPKLRRGCRRKAVHLFYRSHSRSKEAILGPLLRLHTFRTRSKSARMRRRLGGRRAT